MTNIMTKNSSFMNYIKSWCLPHRLASFHLHFFSVFGKQQALRVLDRAARVRSQGLPAGAKIALTERSPKAQETRNKAEQIEWSI